MKQDIYSGDRVQRLSKPRIKGEVDRICEGGKVLVVWDVFGRFWVDANDIRVIAQHDRCLRNRREAM